MLMAVGVFVVMAILVAVCEFLAVCVLVALVAVAVLPPVGVLVAMGAPVASWLNFVVVGIRVTVGVLVMMGVFENMWLRVWVKETRRTQLWLRLEVSSGYTCAGVYSQQCMYVDILVAVTLRVTVGKFLVLAVRATVGVL